MTLAARAIVVDRPVDEVYDEWSDGATLSLRLGDLIEVEPIGDSLTRWTVPLVGVQHQIVMREIRTSARRDIVWLSMSGPRLAGRVSFLPLGKDSTCVRLSVDFDPRNPLGYLADSLGVPDRAVERVLARFQESLAADFAAAPRDGGSPRALDRRR
jgi:uncharacterized membrane protein